MTQTILNPDLIKRQGLTEEEVFNVRDWHNRREQLFGLMERSVDPAWLQILAEAVEKVEFELQRAWKFPLNRNMHTWWMRLPHCRCPQMDNMERVGTPYRIRSEGCPIHGHPQTAWPDAITQTRQEMWDELFPGNIPGDWFGPDGDSGRGSWTVSVDMARKAAGLEELP